MTNTARIMVLGHALTHMKCILRLIICQTAKCWHLKVQLFPLYLPYNNTTIQAVLVIVHKDHTDEWWRKRFCDKKSCVFLLSSGIIRENSSISIASSNLQSTSPLRNCKSQFLEQCSWYLYATRAYQVLPAPDDSRSSKAHTPAHTLKRSGQFVTRIVRLKQRVFVIEIDSLTSTEIWNCIHMNNKKRKRTRQRVPFVLQSKKTSRIKWPVKRTKTNNGLCQRITNEEKCFSSWDASSEGWIVYCSTFLSTVSRLRMVVVDCCDATSIF